VTAKADHSFINPLPQTVSAAVRGARDIAWSQAKKLVETGKVRVAGQVVVNVAHHVEPGIEIEVKMNAPRPRDDSREGTLVFDDAHVVIIEKPSGISSVPFEDDKETTALDMIRAAWRRKGTTANSTPLHVVHRIDKATSGLLMFAKSKSAEIGLAAQFRDHSVKRHYFCLVHGMATAKRIESHLVADRGDGFRGSSRDQMRGKPVGKCAFDHVGVVGVGKDVSMFRVTL